MPSSTRCQTGTTAVNFEGTNVEVLGSPVIIVVAKFLFQALSKHCLSDQTVEEWKGSVRARLQSSGVNLTLLDKLKSGWKEVLTKQKR